MNRTRHLLYRRWCNMRQRCLNPKNPSYINYGARGIRICKGWDKFKNFYAWCQKTYVPGLVLDRINNNGNYTPRNCRWVDYHTSVKNRRNTPKLLAHRKNMAKKMQRLNREKAIQKRALPYKYCPTCKLNRTKEQFNLARNTFSGLQSVCRDCAKYYWKKK